MIATGKSADEGQGWRMTALAAPVRRIESATASFVRELNASGKLPVPRHDPGPGQRFPTAEEWFALRWLLAWERERVVGIAGFRQAYDYHRARDVNEIVVVHGTRRAVMDLVRRIILLSNRVARPCVGAIDIGNERMANFLRTVSRETRTVFEANP